VGQRDVAQQRKRAAFLAAYAENGTITHAAKAAGVDRATHYRWLDDADYAERFGVAQEESIEALEREGRRRAVEGTEEPVYQGGKLVGTIRKYSDTLLIFLLKAQRPAVYRERVDVTMDIRREIERLTDDPAEREAAIAEAEKIIAAAKS
jgi:hypothetical protein